MTDDIQAVCAGLDQRVLQLYEAGQYEEALQPARQLYELRHQHLGEGHPDFAASCNDLASLYQAMGDYTAAAPLYRQALEIKRAALGEQHPDFALSCHKLASLYHDMADYGAAEPLYRQALEIYRTVLGEQHPDFAASCDNLAGLVRGDGRLYSSPSPCAARHWRFTARCWGSAILALP